MNILDYLSYYFPLIILTAVGLYLAIFGEVDRSEEYKSFAHRVSKKH